MHRANCNLPRLVHAGRRQWGGGRKTGHRSGTGPFARKVSHVCLRYKSPEGQLKDPETLQGPKKLKSPETPQGHKKLESPETPQGYKKLQSPETPQGLEKDQSPETSRGQVKVLIPETSQDSKELPHIEPEKTEKVMWHAGKACIAQREDGIWYVGEVVGQVCDSSVMVEFTEPYQDWEAIEITRLVTVAKVGDLQPGDAMHPRVLEMAKRERVVQKEKKIIGDKIYTLVEKILGDKSYTLVEKEHPGDRAIIIATMLMNCDISELRLLVDNTSLLHQKVLILVNQFLVSPDIISAEPSGRPLIDCSAWFPFPIRLSPGGPPVVVQHHWCFKLIGCTSISHQGLD